MIIEEIKYNKEKSAYVKEKLIIIPFKKYSKEFPCSIIPIKALGKTVLMLVDTGANISGFDIDFVNEYAEVGIVPIGTMDVGGIGEAVDSYDIYNFNISIEDVNFIHEFSVGDFNITFEQLNDIFGLKMKIAGIIGADFIEKYGLQIDLKQKIVWFKVSYEG